MALTPNDIRNYEFSNQMRGYDKEEVDDFLEQTAKVLEEVKQENLKLSMEIDSLKSQLAGLRQFEDTIKSAAIDARRNADQTIANAKKEAELIISQAKSEAGKMINTQSSKISELENQISKLELTKKSFISKIRNLLNSHMDMIDDIAKADIKKNLTGDEIEVTDSMEVDQKKMETIATPPQEEAITTEEANAVETIIPVDAEQTTPSEEPSQETEKNIDPELAAALEKYQAQTAEKAIDEKKAPLKQDAPPKPGEFVETTQRAEDIPPGFIGKESDIVQNPKAVGTDKLKISTEAPEKHIEHNNIDIDQSPEKAKENKITPDNIAEALDSVAAKFEEEMDKAEKS